MLHGLEERHVTFLALAAARAKRLTAAPDHEGCDRWATDPERIAIVFRGEGGTRDVWTYRRLSETSKRLANAFATAGLRRGERVAADAAVVAASDEARGSVVRAVIVARSGVDQAALMKRLQDKVKVPVGRHAYPRIVVA